MPRPSANGLPALPANAPGIPAKERYRPKYGVILICPDEAAQAALYDALEAVRSCKIKVVVV